MFICIICIDHVSLYLSVFIYKYRAYSRQGGDGCIFWGTIFRKKGHLIALPKEMPFLTVSNKKIFFETEDKRLGAIVIPNKHLE